MPTFQQRDVALYYEEYGSGYPLLLIAPGGMRSMIDFWHRSPFTPALLKAPQDDLEAFAAYDLGTYFRTEEKRCQPFSTEM